MYRTLPSLSRRRTPCVVSVTRTVNSWSPSRSMSLARTPGVSMSSRFSYGAVYASFVPTGGTFRTPRRRGPLAVAPGMSITRSARHASPAPRTTGRRWRCKVRWPSRLDDPSSLEGRRDYLRQPMVLPADIDRLSARTHRPGGGRGQVAERVGFEPTKSFDSALFKSAAINRSATSPAAQDTSEVRALRAGQADRVRRCRRWPAAR